MEDDNDIPALSGTTLSALHEFYAERAAHQDRFEKLIARVDDESIDDALDMNLFAESWQDSQFWYTNETARILAAALLADSTEGEIVAMVSAPSVYVAAKRLLNLSGNLKVDLKGTVDHIICDPPFLSEDCQIKVAMTVQWLSRSWAIQPEIGVKQSRLVVCTGERMEKIIVKLYSKQGVITTRFMPAHSQQQLSNEFLCYANFECSHWRWMVKT